MSAQYGIERVLEPKNVFPTSAWKLDNNRTVGPREMRINLHKIHIEATSFKQICLEANGDENSIRQKIIDIVIKRGKLHNPVTDTGGLAYGTIAEIHKTYERGDQVSVGEAVLCNCSTANLPMYIARINSIDMAMGQIDVEGYAIVHDSIPIVHKPEGVPLNLLLYVFNESGTLLRLSQLAQQKKKILVVGNSLLSNILFGYVARKTAGNGSIVNCMLDKKSDIVLKGQQADNLLNEIFDEINFVNILEPIESLNKLQLEEQYDLAVNCADIPGAETINILAAKNGGTVLFANLINNSNISLYITEAIGKEVDIRGAEGYLDTYAEFDLEIVKEMAQKLSDVQFESPNLPKKMEQLPADSSKEDRQTMLEDFVCTSKKMHEVLDEMITVAKYDCNVLITGETGVGKEKVANIIQKNSQRKMQPFVKINCASISPSLIESEFFGYEKGAFTGANANGKKGYFEIADNGVIFLDEIGELQMDMQAKLLRVIQDGEFYRVGGTSPVKCNVRILSATNRNLDEYIEKGLFRRDLFYRLNVVQIRVPRLGDRVEDIPALVNLFLKKYGRKFGTEKGIEPEAVEFLKQRSWPGNIRELENVIQRMMINTKSNNISILDAMHELNGTIFGDEAYEEELKNTGSEMILDKLVDDFEKNIIRYACEKYGSTRKAAAAIGISQTQLVRKKKKYGL